MTIERISDLTGHHHTRDINVTEAQIKCWAEGALIQDAMPHLSDDDREFLMSGITPEEWETLDEYPFP
jgi:hypothetical protein